MTAEKISLDSAGFAHFDLVTPIGQVDLHLQIMGEHNVMNALAAAAAALAVNAPLSAIKAGLQQAQPVYQRLVIHQGYQGAKIIDDSYNANHYP